MKWFPIFVALIGNDLANVDDQDGPHEFPNYRACVMHAMKAAPKMETIMRDFLMRSDIKIQWKCAPGISK